MTNLDIFSDIEIHRWPLRPSNRKITVTGSSGKVFLSSGKCLFVLGAETIDIVDKYCTETYTSCLCFFIIDDRTQGIPIQFVVDIEVISSATCKFSTAPAANVLAPSHRSAAFVLLRSWHCFIRSDGVLLL